jgi:4-oxalocrotonate tautomerase
LTKAPSLRAIHSDHTDAVEIAGDNIARVRVRCSVNIKVTREVSARQKAELIRGATDLLVKVLNKSPTTTFVVVDEVSLENWSID